MEAFRSDQVWWTGLSFCKQTLMENNIFTLIYYLLTKSSNPISSRLLKETVVNMIITDDLLFICVHN